MLKKKILSNVCVINKYTTTKQQDENEHIQYVEYTVCCASPSLCPCRQDAKP